VDVSKKLSRARGCMWRATTRELVILRGIRRRVVIQSSLSRLVSWTKHRGRECWHGGEGRGEEGAHLEYLLNEREG